MFAKLPKYIQAGVTFVYIGDRLQSSTQKHYDLPWIGSEDYDVDGKITNYQSIEKANKRFQKFAFGGNLDTSKIAKDKIKKMNGLAGF